MNSSVRSVERRLGLRVSVAVRPHDDTHLGSHVDGRTHEIARVCVRSVRDDELPFC